MTTGSTGVQEHPIAHDEQVPVARVDDRPAERPAQTPAEPAPWRWRPDPFESDAPPASSGAVAWPGSGDLANAFGWAKAWGRW